MDSERTHVGLVFQRHESCARGAVGMAVRPDKNTAGCYKVITYVDWKFQWHCNAW